MYIISRTKFTFLVIDGSSVRLLLPLKRRLQLSIFVCMFIYIRPCSLYIGTFFWNILFVICIVDFWLLCICCVIKYSVHIWRFWQFQWLYKRKQWTWWKTKLKQDTKISKLFIISSLFRFDNIISSIRKSCTLETKYLENSYSYKRVQVLSDNCTLKNLYYFVILPADTYHIQFTHIL